MSAHCGRLTPVAVDFAPRPLASRQGRSAAVPAGARASDLHPLRPWELFRCF